MKRLITCYCLSLVLIACSSMVMADKPAANQAATPPVNMDEMMKKMMELGAPGKEHEMLQKMVGNWDCDVTEYPMFPGMQETKSPGSATFSAKFGGRFIEQEFKSTFGGMNY